MKYILMISLVLLVSCNTVEPENRGRVELGDRKVTISTGQIKNCMSENRVEEICK